MPSGSIPKECNDGVSFFKPDIVFFGESLTDEFRSLIMNDCKECDLLLVMGSSLRVKPVASVPQILGEGRPEIPQILINKQANVLAPHGWDHVYEGDCDDTVKKIASDLQWDLDSSAQ